MILVGTQKTKMLREMWTVKTMFMKFKKGTKTLLGIRMRPFILYFDHFVHVLILCEMLNLKVMD
jgi:hypothetical protein